MIQAKHRMNPQEVKFGDGIDQLFITETKYLS
jgi:hypothetical protein